MASISEIDSKHLNDMLAKSLYRDYKQWTSNEAGRVLKDLDNSRQSWTNEDPSGNPFSPFTEEVPKAVLELLPLARFGTYTKNFTSHKIVASGTRSRCEKAESCNGAIGCFELDE